MLDFLISVWHALRVRPGEQLVERAPLWGFVLYFLVNHYLNTAEKSCTNGAINGNIPL